MIIEEDHNELLQSQNLPFEPSQMVKQFNVQKADFENKDESSETASEGQQPSQYKPRSIGPVSQHYKFGESIELSQNKYGPQRSPEYQQQPKSMPPVNRVDQNNMSFAGKQYQQNPFNQ